MRRTIDPAALSRPELIRLRNEAASQNELARICAGMAKGAARRRYKAIASAHLSNALAIDDALHGTAGGGAGMSDAELLAALASE